MILELIKSWVTQNISVISFFAVSLFFLRFIFINGRKNKYKECAKQFSGPPTWPIVGNGLDFRGSGEDIAKRIFSYMEKYKSPYRIWLGSHLLVVLSHPDDLEIVFRNRSFLGKSKLLYSFHMLWSNALISAPLHVWKEKRKVLQPAFASNILKSFVEIFNEKITNTLNTMMKHVDGPQFDALDFMPYLTFDIVAKTALDLDMDSHKRSTRYHHASGRGLDVCFQCMVKPWLHNPFIRKLLFGKKMNEIREELYNYFKSGLMEKVEAIEANEISDEHDEKLFYKLAYMKGKLRDEKLYDEILSTLVGGTDTASLTSCSFLLAVAIHQEVQDKIYDELYEVFGDSDREGNEEDMKKLIYLEQTLKETSRRFTLVPWGFREVMEDFQIGKYKLPSGTGIIIDALRVHFNPEYYPDPYKFDPDRFEQQAVESRPKHTFIPFMAGSRNCIAQAYSILELKLILSAVLRRYSIQTEEKMENLKVHCSFIMFLSSGYKIKIKLRDRRTSYMRQNLKMN